MCRVLNISASSYYHWRKKPKGCISKTEVLKSMILFVFEENYGIYGAPRIQKSLEGIEFYYSVSWISKLMKVMGIRSKVSKKFKKTTNSNHSYPVSDNLLERKFLVENLGKVWVSDITYIWVHNKWNYLTVIIDLADRAVIGWSVSDNLSTKDTLIASWNMARSNRDISDDFTFHSDRGTQYASTEFREILSYTDTIKQSMSRKGNCWDNAVAESFFKTSKYEMINHHKFLSTLELMDAVGKYINWYNTKRIHSTLGYMTPLEKYNQLMNTNFNNVA